jgi:osmotically-inducible protein OsmY
MANRNQNYQSGRDRDEYTRNNPYRSRDEENRFSRAERDRDFSSYADNDEGDSSVRAGSYDQGRMQDGRRDTGDQGGSGRYAGYGDFGQGDYGGDRQGSYRGGNQDQPNYGYGRGGGQGRYPRYGREAGSSGTSMYGRSFSDYGYGGSGVWNEPYGEGQQYTSRGQYAGESGDRGQHYGKGPKGYQRSDDRLKELICERLHDDPQIDPSEVTINVQGGKVTLEGTVDSRQTKNAIEDVAEQFGVQDVQNNLRVQRAAQTGESGSRSGGKSEENEKGGRQNKH